MPFRMIDAILAVNHTFYAQYIQLFTFIVLHDQLILLGSSISSVRFLDSSPCYQEICILYLL
jgi:hypothetical protein